MSRSMSLDVLVRLRDRLSGPMRRLQRNLRSLGNAARQIGFIGTAIAAISFLGPIQQAGAFEQKLLDIAGTANLSGQAAFDFARQTRREYEDLAFAVGQASDTISDGAGQMIAAGVAEDIVDRTIGTIGKSATAANAAFSDMAGVATSLINTLDVPETELEGALAGLVVAGKEGAFELKDMAKYFPQLTGQMRKFGIVGREASDQIATLLQIARKGTSEPGQAANNLQNFLSKALAPVTQKKFKEMGVDIEAVMKDAAAKGINPLEAMIQKIGKLTGVSASAIGKYMETARRRGLEGGEALEYVRQQLEAIGAAGKIGQLFQDQQVLDFLIPMLANIDEYKRIKGEVAAATGAVIDRDFETQMEGLNRQLTIFREIGTQAMRDVGFAFGTWMPTINQHLMAALKWVRELDRSTGGWVNQALVAAGGGVLLTGALGALGIALPIVGAGFSALASLAAVAIGPIGLLVGALAAGAIYISKNWDRFGPRIMRMWDRAKRAFKEFGRELLDRGREIVRAGREIADRYGPAVRDGIGRAWDWASRRATAGLDATLDRVQRFSRGFSQEADFSGFVRAGEQLGTTFTTLRDIAEDLGSMFGKGDLSEIFTADALGALAGREIKRFGEDLAGLVKDINSLLSAVREITNALSTGKPIPWDDILPPWAAATARAIASAIQAMADAFNALKGAVKGLTFPENMPNQSGSNGQGRSGYGEGSSGGWFGGGSGGGGGWGGDDPANSNEATPGKQSSLPASRQPAAAVRPARADVSGVIRVAVEGPGKIKEAASSNPHVTLAPDRGRAVGRA